MPIYRSLDPTDPLPTPANLRARTAIVDGLLADAYRPLLERIAENALDTESDLKSVYRPLVAEAKHRVEAATRGLMEAVAPALNQIRTANAVGTTELASVSAALPVAGGIYDLPSGGLCPDGYVMTTLTDGTVACVYNPPEPPIIEEPPPPPPPEPPIIVEPPPPPPPGVELPKCNDPTAKQAILMPDGKVYCPPGMVYDPLTGCCKLPPPPPPPTCPPGQVWVDRLQRCVDVPLPPPPPPPPPLPPVVCPEGYKPQFHAESLPELGTFFNSGWVGSLVEIAAVLTGHLSPADIDTTLSMMAGTPIPYSLVGPVTPDGFRLPIHIQGSCVPIVSPPPPAPTTFPDGCYRLVPCTPAGQPLPPPPPPPPPGDGGTSPPTVPPPSPDAGPAIPKKGTRWDNPDYCKEITAEKPPTEYVESTHYITWLMEKEAARAARAGSEAPFPLSWLFTAFETVLRGYGSISESFHEKVKELVHAINDLSPDENTKIIGAGITLGTGKVLQKIIGFPTDDMLKSLTYRINYFLPTSLPDQGSVDSLYLTNQITNEQWECWTRALNNLPESHRMARDAKRVQPTPDQVLQDWLRVRTPDSQLDGRLRTLGITDPTDRALIKRTSQFAPPASDAIRFAVKDVFDPNKLGREEMLAELREQTGLRETLGLSGIGELEVNPPIDGKTKVDIPSLYWLASYDEVSPTQAEEMNHRLRPNRVRKFAQLVEGKTVDQLRNLLPGAKLEPDPGGKGTWVIPDPVSMYDLAKLFKEVDYNPIWRARLAAISYRVPGRIDIRRLYAAGVYGDARGVAGWDRKLPPEKQAIGPAERELYEQYLDGGYNSVDSADLGYYTSWEYDRSKGSAQRSQAKNAACAAYQVGAIKRDEVTQLLVEAGYKKEEAERWGNVCESNRKVKEMREAVGFVRSLYLNLGIDRAEADRRLSLVGVDFEARRSYLNRWELKLTGQPREATVAQLVQWYKDRSIDAAELTRRLVMLKYSDVDARRIVRTAELGELAKTAREQERVRRAQESANRRAEADSRRRAKETQTAEEKRLRVFLATRPNPDLKKWLNEQLITVPEVFDTLKLKGYSDADANRWITSATGAAGGGGEGG